MNKLLRILLLSAVLGGVAAMQAQPAPKIFVIDMSRALDSYYKYQDSKNKVNGDGQKAQEQLDGLTKQMNALNDEIKDMVEKSKSPALSTEARNQAEGDAQKKYQELQQMQAQAQDFLNHTRQQLQQRMKNYTDMLLDDIKNTATKIAKLRGATLVLDKGGPTLIGVPAIVYSDASYDLTDDVLTELNKDRPTPAPTPAPVTAVPATTAPALAPTQNPPTQFSVPNVTPTKKP